MPFSHGSRNRSRWHGANARASGGADPMPSVVFLRAVNVGGHKAFQPSAVAKALAHCGASSIGAAGTFVIQERISQVELRAELLRCLPWECEMMIAPARDVKRLAEAGLFPQGPS